MTKKNLFPKIPLINMEYISQLEDKIENLIGRKVSFYLASKFLIDKESIVLYNSKEK